MAQDNNDPINSSIACSRCLNALAFVDSLENVYRTISKANGDMDANSFEYLNNYLILLFYNYCNLCLMSG